MSATPLLQARFEAALMPTYGVPPLALVRGEGCRVWDADGREYTDLIAGIAVSSLGHAHPAVVEAVTRQVRAIAHTSNLQVGTAVHGEVHHGSYGAEEFRVQLDDPVEHRLRLGDRPAAERVVHVEQRGELPLGLEIVRVVLEHAAIAALRLVRLPRRERSE